MEIMLEIPKNGPRSIKLNNYYWKVVTPMVKDGLFNAGHMEVKSKDDAHVVIKNLERNSVITISSVDGKTIYKNLNTTDGDFTLSVVNWNKGIYLVNVQNKEKNTIKKLLLN